MYVFNKKVPLNVVDLLGLIENCSFTIYYGEELDIGQELFTPMYRQRRQNPTCNFQIPSEALTAFVCCDSTYVSQQMETPVWRVDAYKRRCLRRQLEESNIFPESYWMLLDVIQAAEGE